MRVFDSNMGSIIKALKRFKDFVCGQDAVVLLSINNYFP